MIRRAFSGLIVTAQALLISCAAVWGASGFAAEVELSPISGSPDSPRRHFRLRDPADLPPEEALRIYEIVDEALSVGYQHSGDPVAQSFRKWRRYNSAPYLSATHGNNYLSNYVNETGEAYGHYEKAGEMPVGSIIAKDSFSVTESRQIVMGPLFIMEKMPAGFYEITGDWKYTQIQPDGTVLGVTNGYNSEAVRYCIGCHQAKADQDHLYFIPDAYRVQWLR